MVYRDVTGGVRLDRPVTQEEAALLTAAVLEGVLTTDSFGWHCLVVDVRLLDRPRHIQRWNKITQRYRPELLGTLLQDLRKLHNEATAFDRAAER